MSSDEEDSLNSGRKKFVFRGPSQGYTISKDETAQSTFELDKLSAASKTVKAASVFADDVSKPYHRQLVAPVPFTTSTGQGPPEKYIGPVPGDLPEDATGPPPDDKPPTLKGLAEEYESMVASAPLDKSLSLKDADSQPPWEGLLSTEDSLNETASVEETCPHQQSLRCEAQGSYPKTTTPPRVEMSDSLHLKHDGVTAQILSELRTLRKENELLKQANSNAEPPKDWEVFHRIDDKVGGNSAVCMEPPSWDIANNGEIVLVQRRLVKNYQAYLSERPHMAFAVIKCYSVQHRTAQFQSAWESNLPLPSPQPFKEMIQLVSRDMKEALSTFLSQQSGLRQGAPRMDLDTALEPPFVWAYHNQTSDVENRLPKHQARLVRMLMTWIDTRYGALHRKVAAQFEQRIASYRTMKFLIIPGDILVSKEDGSAQAVMVLSSPDVHSPQSSPQQPKTGLQSTKSTWEWRVKVWAYDYDGTFYKTEKTITLRFQAFSEDDEISLDDLSYIPLRFLDGAIRSKLQRRGSVFWNCRGQKLITYRNEMTQATGRFGQRYMVDYHTYKRLHPSPDNKKVEDSTRLPDTFGREEEPPSEPDLLILPSKTVAFNFMRKAWEDVQVDLITDVEWNKNSFSQHLVVDDETKELIEALVTSQLSSEKSTDHVDNKGKGLILLLHGSPGTGKTFTAEGVAELAEKPLYPVTCGDIGTKPGDVEKYLDSVFHLGKLWNCVVLLDEAEVFLEQRQLNDLERNALVSVFLRALEYYDGILILTSNRVGTFDEAFKSRIQLALHYEPLRAAQRKQIWKNFFTRLESLDEENIDFDDVRLYYDELSINPLNGRQIRNSITTARQLAQFKGTKMNYSHLQHAIKVSGKFDNYLLGLRSGLSDEEIAKEDGVR